MLFHSETVHNKNLQVQILGENMGKLSLNYP